MTGLVTAIYDVGCALGAVAAFGFGDALGRKRSIILASLVVMVGAVVQTACFNYWQMFIARTVSGLGVGFATLAVPILQSETLPAHKGGALLVIQSALTIVGVAVASWLCFATSHTTSSFRWRFPVGCQLIGPILVLVLCICLPKSPRWLASQGQIENARRTIFCLLDKTEDSAQVAGQMNEIMENIAQESDEHEPSWREVFINANRTKNLQRVFLGMAPYMMNQWSGVNSLAYYLAYILQTYLHYSSTMALILASVCFTQLALLSSPAYFYIDRIGRRWSVMLSSGACSICMVIVAGTLTHQTYSFAAAAVAFIFLYLDC